MVSARDLSGVKNQKSRLYVKFSAPVVKEDCEISTQNYYVNMGHAVRCLREELPSLFYKEPNFDIYRFLISHSRLFFLTWSDHDGHTSLLFINFVAACLICSLLYLFLI